MTAHPETAGFTLIELMVVVAIVAIFTTIAAPAMTEFVDRRRAIGAAESVRDLLEFARSEAVKQSRAITVELTSSDPWMSVEDDDGTTLRTLAGAAYHGVTFNAGDLAQIRFDSVRGTARCDDGICNNDSLVVQSAGGKQLHVRMNALGRPSTCSPSGSAHVSGYGSCS